MTRGYKFSKQFIGATSVWTEVNLEECNKLVGYSPDDYVAVQEYLEAVRIELNKPPKK